MKLEGEWNVSEQIRVHYRVVSPWFKEDYLPQYATAGAAGMDLHACIPEALLLQPGMRLRVPTGIAVQLPNQQVVALVYARSGLAWKHGLGLPNGVGVIDSDYTGEIMVLLTNFSDQPYAIEPGARIAQIVFAPVYTAQFIETSEFQPTARGSRGFGSTGTGSLAE